MKALCLAVAAAFADSGAAQQLPTGGMVARGSATIDTSGAAMTVTQTSPRAVINWNSFDIGNGASVTFAQPGATSIAVNRVTGGAGPSAIDGALSANGNVMILNPNGVLFGSTATVNVGGLIASTGSINDDQFMSDPAASFVISGAATGAVSNAGAITVSGAGLAAFVAPSVCNSGLIQATGGRIALASAQEATVSLNGGLYEIAVTKGVAEGAIANTGSLITGAASGSIVLSALDAANLVSGVINLEGVQQATRIEVHGGKVVLTSDLNAAKVAGSSSQVEVHAGAQIQDAVDIAGAGATIDVWGGSYTEGHANVDYFGAPGGQKFGLHVYKDDLLIRGRNSAGGELTGLGDPDMPTVTAQFQTGFGAQHFVSGSGVTLEGLKFKPVSTGTNKTLEVIGNDFTLRNSVIDNSGNATAAAFYISDFGIDGRPEVESFRLENNRFIAGTTASALVVVGSGAGNDTDAANRIFSGNELIGTPGLSGARGFQIQGELPHVPWQLSTAGAVTVENNSFANLDVPVRTVGELSEPLDWNSVFNGNTFVGGAALAFEGNTSTARSSMVSIAPQDGTTAPNDAPDTRITRSIQASIDRAQSGDTVRALAGTYAEPLTLTKSLSLRGTEGARLVVADNTDGITINANNVTVYGLEIAGPVSSPYLTYAWGSNISRGIVVRNGVTGFNIVNNDIHDVRNGILIDGRNTGAVTGNRIENTKSGISVQYTDAAGIAIAGNSEGPVGNEWGLNLHLNGFLDGGTIRTNPVASAPTPAWQQALLDLSSANGGWSVQDQGYSSSNRTRVSVATGGSSTNQGSPLAPLNTIQGGINAVVAGGRVDVAGGTYMQSSTLNVSKSLTLAGAGRDKTLIDARGVGSYGLSVSADNVTLSDFTLYGPAANVGSAYGIKVQPAGSAASSRLHNFTIMNVTSRGAGRAELDLNGVVGATIDGVIADGAPVGGTGTTAGAGIQITDSADVTITRSTTRNNAWGGVALYQANRFFDQQTTGIVVQADNTFNEANPLYLQDESSTRNFGALALHGFDYAVRNSDAASHNDQYTWLQYTLNGAVDLAVSLTAPGQSYVQEWNVSAPTQNFHVGVGNVQGGGTRAMSIAKAIAAADSGASIHVGAGNYAENLTIGKTLSLIGAGADQTVLQSPTAGTGTAVAINSASGVTLSDLSIENYQYGLTLSGTSHDATVERVAFDGNTYAMRNGTTTKADNFRMLDSSITGGLIGVQTYNGVSGGNPTASFANALFRNVRIDGPSYKGFYFETADNLVLRDVTIENAGNFGGQDPSQFQKYGHAVDVNLKYAAFDSITFDNLVVRNSGRSSGDATRAAVVVKTRGVPGDNANYVAAPASLQSVNISGGSIEGSDGVGIRFEDLSNGAGGKPTVVVGGGTQFRNNGQDILVGAANVDATAAVFVDAADGFAIEDRVTHALDQTGRGLVTWESGSVYVTPSSGSIQRGVDAAAPGSTVHVKAGTYGEDVTVAGLRNLLFDGAGSTVQGLTLNPGAAGSGIGGRLTANGATGFFIDAPIFLLGDTSLATAGANIRFNGDIQGAGGNAYALSLNAGSGDVLLASGGTAGDPLGRLEVTAGNFTLLGTMWVSGYDIDALGNVALSDHTLRSAGAGVANAIDAGGSVTGSTVADGGVQIRSSGSVAANVTAQGEVAVAAVNVSGTYAASRAMFEAQNKVSIKVDVPDAVEVRAGGTANVSGSAPKVVVDAPSGSVSGDFGQVTNAGSGVIQVNGRPEVGAPLVASTENNSRIVPAEVATAASVQEARAAGGELAPLRRARPEGVADALASGEAVELDLSPSSDDE